MALFAKSFGRIVTGANEIRDWCAVILIDNFLLRAQLHGLAFSCKQEISVRFKQNFCISNFAKSQHLKIFLIICFHIVSLIFFIAALKVKGDLLLYDIRQILPTKLFDMQARTLNVRLRPEMAASKSITVY